MKLHYMIQLLQPQEPLIPCPQSVYSDRLLLPFLHIPVLKLLQSGRMAV